MSIVEKNHHRKNIKEPDVEEDATIPSCFIVSRTAFVCIIAEHQDTLGVVNNPGHVCKCKLKVKRKVSNLIVGFWEEC